MNKHIATQAAALNMSSTVKNLDSLKKLDAETAGKLLEGNVFATRMLNIMKSK